MTSGTSESYAVTYRTVHWRIWKMFAHKGKGLHQEVDAWSVQPKEKANTHSQHNSGPYKEPSAGLYWSRKVQLD